VRWLTWFGKHQKKDFQVLRLNLTCAILLTSLFAIAATEKPTFYASFDRDFSAEVNTGRVEGKLSQEILWETLQNLLQPGISGQAAVVGTFGEKKEKVCHAVFDNQEWLDTETGSVMFWVKPVNWNGQDKNFHIFFQAVGADGLFLIYKYINSSTLNFLIGPSKPVNGKNVWSLASAGVGKWNAGEWHHLAAVYEKDKLSLYLDGQRASTIRRGVLPPKPFTKFSVGAIAPQSWKTPLDSTLIDEFKIFAHALTPEEVAEDFRLFASSSEKISIKDVSTLVVPDKAELELGFTLEGKVTDSLFKLTDSAGKEVFLEKQHSLLPRRTISVPFSVLKPGDYSITIIALNDKGENVHEKRQSFMVPELPMAWEGNKIGLQQGVPPPWEALVFESRDNVVRTLKAEYRFGNNPLPQQIQADGSALLSRPVTLALNAVPLNPENDLQSVEITPETLTLRAEGRAANFKINTLIRSEFDGFVWITVTLTPSQPIAVKSLCLDFPFLREQSSLFNSMNKFYYHHIPGHCGAFKDYTMNLYKRPPIIFVGNDDCGLQWFCEKLQSWYSQDQERTLELIPGNTENLLRLNLIDHEVTVSAPLRYEFGFQCVPMRPMPSGWRSWCPYSNFDPVLYWSKFHHYPCASALRTDPEYQALFETKSKRFGKELFYYFAGFTITPLFPEWSWFSAQWMLTPPEHGRYGRIGDPKNYFVWVCPGSESYRDFYLARLQVMLDQLDIDNLYFDNQDAQMCDNARHGCGYVGTDGHRYQSYNLLATRALNKRIYKMFKAARPEGRIMRHMSAKPVAPVISFCDMLADGELYNGTIAEEESYYSIFNPEMFRASFRGSLWGIPQFFIPQFVRAIQLHNPSLFSAWDSPEKLQQQREKTRHFKGYFILHDAQILPLFGVKVDDWEGYKQTFGVGDQTLYLGHFGKDLPWQAPLGVLVSGYIENGKLMLLVMNESQEDTVEIILLEDKLAALGIRSLLLHNTESGAPVPLKNGRITLPLKTHDYTIMWNL
jgi:hypothetical protein